MSWGSTVQNNSRIGKIQKKAIRAITKSKYNAHTTPLFKKRGLLKFDDTLKLACFKFYHKYKHQRAPPYFMNMFTPGTQTDINQSFRPRRRIKQPSPYRDTVHNLPYTQNDIKIETTRKIYCQACIRHLIPKLINENYLPEIVLTKLDTHSLKGFTTYTIKYILDNYDAFCHIPNCYICKKKQ